MLTYTESYPVFTLFTASDDGLNYMVFADLAAQNLTTPLCSSNEQSQTRNLNANKYSKKASLWKNTNKPLLENKLVSAAPSRIENLIAQIDAVNKEYELTLGAQQRAIVQNKCEHLTDYQLMHYPYSPGSTQASPLHTLSELTFKLSTLYATQQNLIEQVLQASSALTNTDTQASLHGIFKNKKVLFEEISVPGDGWCALKAANISDPVRAIEELMLHLSNVTCVNFIAKSIENNYLSSLSLKEPFVLGNVLGNDVIVEKIKNYYALCQTESSDLRESAYAEFKHYIENPSVQRAYLKALLTSKYADCNIAAAYLSLSGKKLALFIDLNLPDKKLVNCVADEVDVQDRNTVCVIFHPNTQSSISHYNRLVIAKPYKGAQLLSFIRQPKEEIKEEPVSENPVKSLRRFTKN
jgi:hypothetical protein